MSSGATHRYSYSGFNKGLKPRVCLRYFYFIAIDLKGVV